MRRSGAACTRQTGHEQTRASAQAGQQELALHPHGKSRRACRLRCFACLRLPGCDARCKGARSPTHGAGAQQAGAGRAIRGVSRGDLRRAGRLGRPVVPAPALRVVAPVQAVQRGRRRRLLLGALRAAASALARDWLQRHALGVERCRVYEADS